MVSNSANLCIDLFRVSHKANEGLKIIIGTSVTFAVGVTVALIVSIYMGPATVCASTTNRMVHVAYFIYTV